MIVVSIVWLIDIIFVADPEVRVVLEDEGLGRVAMIESCEVG